MTTQDKLISRERSLIELVEALKNASQVCKIPGVSQQHFCALHIDMYFIEAES